MNNPEELTQKIVKENYQPIFKVEVKENIKKEEAAEIKKTLEAAGAVVEIK